MSTLVRACAVADVAPESAIPVEVPRNGSRLELAIVHSNGNFYAISDECSHAQIPLSVPIYRCIVEGSDVLVDVSAPLDPNDADPTAAPTYAQEF